PASVAAEMRAHERRLPVERVAREGVRLRADADLGTGRVSKTSKIGVVYNPKSAANLGKAPLRAVGVPCGRPSTRAELAELMRDFARAEVNIVTVSGGDG